MVAVVNLPVGNKLYTREPHQHYEPNRILCIRAARSLFVSLSLLPGELKSSASEATEVIRIVTMVSGPWSRYICHRMFMQVKLISEKDVKLNNY